MATTPWSDLKEDQVIEAVSHLRSLSDVHAAESPTLIESMVRQKVTDPETQKQLLDKLRKLSREREF